MTKSGKIKLAVAAVAAIAVTGVVVMAMRKPKVSYETETVDRGAVVEEISVTGSLVPTSKISLQPEASGRVSAVRVATGDEVKNGQVLVEIDARDLNARIASQRAAVDSSKARLAELVAGATPQELALAEASVDSAESKLDAAVAAQADAVTALTNAKQNYDAVVAKAATLLEAKRAAAILGFDEAVTVSNDAITRLTSPMFTSDDFLTFSATNAQAESDARSTRKDARDALVRLEAAAASAKSAGTVDAALSAQAEMVANVGAVKIHLEADAEVLKYALNMDATTKATYQQNVNSGLTALNASLQKLSTDKANIELQQRLNATDVAAAQTAVSNAQASLTNAGFAVTSAERALATAQADLAIKRSGNRAEVIAAQRARVASDEATLVGLYAELAKRKIMAPLDAVVTDVSAEPGEIVQPSQVVVTLNAKGKFEIVSNVSEVDIASVAVGQPVTITLDAFPTSEKWTGQVVTVNPAEKVVEGVIFYETKIMFDQEDPRLKSGMTANLDIETGRRENALRVPLRAIRSRPGVTYVEILVDGKPQERVVKLGIENNQYVEVLEGLSEGEAVIVSTTEKK